MARSYRNIRPFERIYRVKDQFGSFSSTTRALYPWPQGVSTCLYDEGYQDGILRTGLKVRARLSDDGH